ncbi:S-layer homology domain-containing protein [Sporosarcina sp. FSL K6-1522]|uniref:S-layer homology domain-containing protein n=1 Tax=Sporosarcina sp. FSL K6-1522 TaxID=2921554 RepID=UPI00315AE55F
MRKYPLLGMLFVLFSVLIFPEMTEANTKKTAVYFSEVNDEYSQITRPGGTHTFYGEKKSIDAKNTYSAIWDKQLKVFHSLQQDGYNVEKINEKDLTNQAKLQQYDTIVFAYGVLMTHEQRQVVKQYVRDGGGIVSVYAGARNEADPKLWKTNALDLTPLIFKTQSWIWEWDNLSEVLSSGFVSDNAVKNLRIAPGMKTHPVIRNAEKKLGRSLELYNDRASGEWVEILSPYSGYVAPLLQIEQATSLDGKPQYVKRGTPMALATEYGDGRVIYIGFKMFDFLQVDAPEAAWRDSTKGLAYSGTHGAKDARVFLNESVNWTSETLVKKRVVKYDVNVSMSELRAYQSPQKDYVMYGTAHVKNTGDTPVRGTLLVEVFDPKGKPVANYERYLPGLTPYSVKAGPQNESINLHNEKFVFRLPLNAMSGNYEVRTTFLEGHRDLKGYKIRAASMTMKKQGTAKAVFTKQQPFKDVHISDDAYPAVENLASLGIIRGYGNGIFKPDVAVTRKQAVDMILKSTNIPVRKGLTLAATDISTSSVDYDLIATAVHHGLLKVENGKVRPYANMTRAEAANALVNGFTFKAIPTHSFNDVTNSTNYHQEIHILSQLEVAKGYVATNTFAPNNTLTRKHFSSFLDRSLRAVQR